MNASFPRVDSQLSIALVISIALHVVLIAIFALVQETPAAKVVSTMNVRLSTAVVSVPPTTFPEPEVVEPSAEPIPQLEPVLSTVEPAVAEPRRTPAPVTRTATESRQLNLDTASLQTFIESRTGRQPPSFGTQTDVAEQYRRQWHQRVQRIGQLNYPEAASRMNLTGQLTLNVAINTDGSLASVGIAQSSGHDELDFAVLEIVRQSSPFEPLPPNLPRSNGRFPFESTWEFRR